MNLSREEAYDILELPVGTDFDSIRTAYKRLALKWHPDKHDSSADSIKKFQQISRAYKRLSYDDDDDDNDYISLTLEQMLGLFKEVFFAKSYNSFNGSGCDSSDDDDDDDLEDDVRYSNLFPDKFKLNKDLKRARAAGGRANIFLTEEEINKNAEELITEEEKEKRRAEKRRAKKKRRRERKKLEKALDDDEDDNPVIKEEDKKPSKTKGREMDAIEKPKSKKSEKRDSSSSSDEVGFDPNSAFFTKVVNKKKKGLPTAPDQQHRKEKNRKDGGGSEEEAEDLDPVVLRSRQLAIKGNEMAQLGHYNAAIELFTEAIKLDPKDFRFFGNRSYCFDRIQQYDRALKDAEKAIHLSKEWPKGYFRKGRALAGLRMFSEAEDAFTQVLKLDKNCEDAVQELLRVRTYQLTEMGFSRQQAETAIKQHGTVQAALDSLLAGVAENSLSGEVYLSDDDDDGFTVNHINKAIPSKKDTQKMDPRNPEGLTALWVGNVLPDKVDEKKLLKIFSKYGPVTSVRCLPEKYCAFINFKTKEAAGKAMQCLQGADCGGQKLLIKFPDNPIVNGSGNVTIRKTTTTVTTPSPSSSTQQVKQQTNPQLVGMVTAVSNATTANGQNQPKVSGPVNGDECYFWRTTGCSFGDKCRNKHIPSHAGIDKKPWQKSQQASSTSTASR